MSFETATLGSLGTIVGGGTPSTAIPDYWGDEIPWVTPKDMSVQSGRYLRGGERALSQLGLSNSAAKVLPKGSVVLSSRAPIGLVGIAERPLTTNQGCRSFVPGPRIHSEYVYYAFLTMKEQFESRASGSTFMEISGTALAALPLAFPPFPEQQAIAEVLGALDDKIAANTALISTLKAVSAAVLSASGSIARNLEDVAEFHNRRRVPLSANQRADRPGTVPYYGANGQMATVDEALFNEPLALVGEDGSVVREDGAPYVTYVWGPSWVNNHAHVLTGKGISTELLAVALESARADTLVTGAVQPKLSMGNAKRLQLRLPDSSHIELVNSQVRAAYASIRGFSDENRTLAATRDALLPQLMSGKLRVRDAEAAASEAGA